MQKEIRIGITGCGGFIGSSLFGAFESGKADPFYPVNIDNLTQKRQYPALSKDLQAIEDNLDWVLHFGAITSITDSVNDLYSNYSNNINGTLSALDVARRSKANFLFMSSYVYGDPLTIPIAENHPRSASNPYMGSKIIGEELCTQFCKFAGLPFVILRGFNIYGERQIIKGRLIPDLISAARKGDQLVINDPYPRRDYLYIADFIDLIKKILTAGPVQTGIFNAGYGKTYSNLEVAELVRKISGISLPVLCMEKPRKNDIRDASPDVSLIKKVFNWEPKFTLKDGLKKCLLYS